MLGRTHFFAGMATALAVCQPQTMPMLVAGAGAGALGGVIPDIDSGTSGAHQDANRVIGVSVAAVAVVVVADLVFHVGIYERLMRNSSIARALGGALVFILICAFGKEQPHRSFMHSILALVLLTACTGVIFPDAAPYFAAGFASHILLDLLNKRRVRVFYPFGRGFCLRLCSAGGIVNKLLLAVGIVASVILVVTSSPVTRAVAKALSYTHIR